MKVTELLICVLCAVISVSSDCTEEETLRTVRKPIFDFSVKLLDRVSVETDGHFVYSPISTWLQLISLAEGARSKGLKEIWKVTGLTGYRRKTCYRRKLRQILNNMDENVTSDSERSSVIIVDKFYKVKRAFKREVEALSGTKVLSLNFNKPEDSARKANEVLEEQLGTVDTARFKEVVFPEDFSNSRIIFTDAAYFKSAWKYPFNYKQTKEAEFFSNTGVVGKVNMMNQIAYFNYAEIELINARVVELPCIDERISLLIYLPLKDDIVDLFFKMQATTLSGILNELKLKGTSPVNISLPRFEIVTEMSNIRELLFDMGINKIFYPNTSHLRGVSDYTLDVSLMTQKVTIEVTEKDVLASSGPENIVQDVAIEFNANRPFGYTLVDKETEIMLFAGVYSEPTLY